MDAQAYLERLDTAGRVPVTLDGLAEVTLAHHLTVPFENLDIVAGRPIELDLEQIFDKVVRRRRGGFCYELNGLLAALLAELGFSVTLLAARSVNPDDGRLGPEFDHLVLRVDLERPFLVDVGWGETFRTPLALEDGAAQDDYRVHARPDGAWEVTERADGAWRAQYRFDLVPRRLPDFADTCRWQQTDSPFFTGHRVCTLATPDGRVTLMDDRLITTSPAGSSERAVAEDEVPELLERLFGVVL